MGCCFCCEYILWTLRLSLLRAARCWELALLSQSITYNMPIWTPAGLSEGDKVQRVLDKFPAVPASRALDGALQKLVGRIVVAGQHPFFSPAKGTPCVYFHLVVEEE